MTDAGRQTDVRDYLSGVNETIRRSRELIAEGNRRIEETKAKCQELGITPEQLQNFDFRKLDLPDELMQMLEEDERKWQGECQDLLAAMRSQTSEEVRLERMNKLGAMMHPYRI